MEAGRVYDLIAERAANSAAVEEVLIGLTWTLAQSEAGYGLAMSPMMQTRTLTWSGTLTGKTVSGLLPWLRSWNPYEATVAMALANSVINTHSPLLQQACPIDSSGNLSVFEFFAPLLKGQRVVVIGRYPGLDRFQQELDITVLERQPGEGDLPDTACEYLLPQADWVFLTATSLINKTFPRLAELSQNAALVLMGPTLPWLAELADFGVDFIAGVAVDDAAQLRRTVAEGGGTRIFGNGVSYRVAATSEGALAQLKDEISRTAAERGALKEKMEQWYAQQSGRRFPEYGRLEQVGGYLSQLDSRYKRLWDAQRHLESVWQRFEQQRNGQQRYGTS